MTFQFFKIGHGHDFQLDIGNSRVVIHFISVIATNIDNSDDHLSLNG